MYSFLIGDFVGEKKSNCGHGKSDFKFPLHVSCILSPAEVSHDMQSLAVMIWVAT